MRIGELTLKDDFEGFSAFFEEVRKDTSDFVVLIARRCFALYEIFTQNKAQSHQKIISNNALLLYAKYFAEYYIQKDRFPTVLLVDDLLLYGRSIVRLLDRFRELVLSELRSNDKVKYSEADIFYARRDLDDAITIKVYAINRTPRIVDGIYRNQVQATVVRYTEELAKLRFRATLSKVAKNKYTVKALLLSRASVSECAFKQIGKYICTLIIFGTRRTAKMYVTCNCKASSYVKLLSCALTCTTCVNTGINTVYKPVAIFADSNNASGSTRCLNIKRSPRSTVIVGHFPHICFCVNLYLRSYTVVAL